MEANDSVNTMEQARLDVPSPVSSASLQVGTVTEVSGFRLTCRLFESMLDGRSDCAHSTVQVGMLIKVATPTTMAFGFVDSVAFERSRDGESMGPARADIDLLGEVQTRRESSERFFVRGITVYPVLGAAVFEASEADMSLIYGMPSAQALAIGSLHQFPETAACLKPEEFFTKHFAILGNSGAGKSCAVALILREMLTAHHYGHVLILDPHGEYGCAFPDLAESVTPENLRLPYWLFGFDEITEVFCSTEPEARNREDLILKEAIVHAKRSFLEESGSTAEPTVDTPTPYEIEHVIQHISDAMGRLLRADTPQPYLRLIRTIEDRKRDPRYRFMFEGRVVRDDMADILAHILRIPVNGRPIIVLDISALPSEIVNVVVSLLCRLVFDFAVRGDHDDVMPILVVCEEAHRYIPRDRSLGFEPARRSITRFANEGRKYGVSLCAVTQRPSDLSENILSQCNTVVALRMTNTKDQNFVRGLLPDAAAGLLNALPTLGRQEAIIVGEGVVHPMRVRFRDLPPNHRPKLAPTNFPSAWDTDTKDRTYLKKIIARWRGW